MTEYQSAPPISTANYPHIFLQLRDGQIINVENGEVIISLSQFVANESAEPPVNNINSTLSSQASPRPLHIDSDYISSTQESKAQQDFAVDDVMVRPPLGVLNQSLLGHEEIVIAESTIEDVEEEVMREVRSLISDPPPEGWLDNKTHMVYNAIESAWGSEGITNEEMELIKQHHASKVPTNADCIKHLYSHEEVLIQECPIISITGVAKSQRLWKRCIVDGRFDYDDELILRDPQSISVVSGSPSCTFQTQKIQNGHGRRE